MSLDAVIERVKDFTVEGEAEVLRLELAPRVDSNGQDTCAGRSALHLMGERTFEPRVGMEIWGGADFVEIVDGPQYSRKGTRIRERPPCPFCDRLMHWAEIFSQDSRTYREVWRCDCGQERQLR